jgi:hypothetical protein
VYQTSNNGNIPYRYIATAVDFLMKQIDRISLVTYMMMMLDALVKVTKLLIFALMNYISGVKIWILRADTRNNNQHYPTVWLRAKSISTGFHTCMSVRFTASRI